MNKGLILVLVSAANKIPLREGGTHPTGIFLGELVESLEMVIKDGHELVFTSPGGVKPTIDENSRRLMYWGFSQSRLENGEKSYLELLGIGLNNPIPLDKLVQDESQLEKFDALFVPGGHAPMVDLLHENFLETDALNASVGKLLLFFHQRQRPTALICHAPAALAAAPKINGKWIYEGYKMTCFSRFLEWFAEDSPVGQIPGHLKEYTSELLEEAGAKLVNNNIPTMPFVVEDRELLTGQDPFASRLMGKRFSDKLNRFLNRPA